MQRYFRFYLDRKATSGIGAASHFNWLQGIDYSGRLDIGWILNRRFQISPADKYRDSRMRNIVNALLLADDRILLALRSQTRKAYPGLWSFPGGHVESGEILDQALHRELFEEVGITLLDYCPIVQFSDPNEAKKLVRYHLYAVTSWEGEPEIIDDEHSELR